MLEQREGAGKELHIGHLQWNQAAIARQQERCQANQLANREHQAGLLSWLLTRLVSGTGPWKSMKETRAASRYWNFIAPFITNLMKRLHEESSQVVGSGFAPELNSNWKT